MGRSTFNAHRLYQATNLAPTICQLDMGATEHRVLEVLGRMMADHTNLGTLTIIDTCFPSLLTLARETMFSERCVRTVLDRLLDSGLITKSKIPGRLLHKGKNRNKFENNRYHVVPEVWDVVHSPFSAAYGTTPAFAKSAPRKISEKDQAVLDNIAEPRPDPNTPVVSSKSADSSAILNLLQDKFPTHSSWSHANADRIMSACVKKMIEKAGSPERVIEFLGSLSDKTEAAIRKSGNLGGYLETCVAEWIKNLPKSAASSDAEQLYYPPCRNLDDLINYMQTTVPSTLDLRGDIEVWDCAQKLIDQDPSHMPRRVAAILFRGHYEFPASFASMKSIPDLVEFLADEYPGWSESLEEELPSTDDWSPLEEDAKAEDEEYA